MVDDRLDRTARLAAPQRRNPRRVDPYRHGVQRLGDPPELPPVEPTHLLHDRVLRPDQLLDVLTLFLGAEADTPVAANLAGHDHQRRIVELDPRR